MKLIKFLCKLIVVVIVTFSLLLSSVIIHGMYETRGAKISDQRVREIYKKIISETGQVQDQLPLEIVNEPILNAYNNGEKVVIYRGMLDYVQNEDELAFILGHEVSHGMLKHVYYPEFQKNRDEIAETEANADKMGAIYMMKAGYNICVAREIWKRMRVDDGNYQNADHPDYSYRYDELNIGCGA